jgi:hypothetical protein
MITKNFLRHIVMKLIGTKLAGKKPDSFKSVRKTVPSRMRLNFSGKQPLSRMYKNCPNCAAQVPLAALLCDACEHNFIAMPSYRHKLLSPPKTCAATDRGSVSKMR